MKKLILTFLNIGLLCIIFIFISSSSSKAVDRIVQELGPTGTFQSITSAVNASSDGDRIIIFNRAGGLPWQEAVTVGKSLTFLPAIDGVRFLVLGTWTVSPPSSGKEVRIIGMENLGGDIRATSAAPAGVRTKVEIAGCEITGDIEFQVNNYDMTVASNRVISGASGFDGTIGISYGNIYGNQTDASIGFGNDGIPGNEVFDVIGNTCNDMSWASSNYFFRIANNNIRRTSSSSGSALSIVSVKNSSVEVNTIENNSVYTTGFSNFTTIYGINITSLNASNATINVLNNAVAFSGGSSPTTYGISLGGSANIGFFAAYNHVSGNDFAFQNIPVGLNVVTSFTLSAQGVPSGTNIQDGGHPGNDYIDHDLSRNDPGCYGGSFNFTNYSITASPVIFHVETPRTVLQGSTLNVTSEGYDR